MSPDPLHAFVIHAPPLLMEQGRDPPTPIPPILPREGHNPTPEGRFIIRSVHDILLRGPALSHDSTGPVF